MTGREAESAAVLAERAAEAVRELNRVTVGGGGYDTAADVSALVGALSALVGRLPQVLDQAATAVERAADAGWLSLDSTGSVAPDLAALMLREVGGPADTVRVLLEQAHGALSHVGGWLNDDIHDIHDGSDW